MNDGLNLNTYPAGVRGLGWELLWQPRPYLSMRALAKNIMSLLCAALLAASGSLAHAAVSRRPAAAHGHAVRIAARHGTVAGPRAERGGRGAHDGGGLRIVAGPAHRGVAARNGARNGVDARGRGKAAGVRDVRQPGGARRGSPARVETARDRRGAHGRLPVEAPDPAPRMHRVHGRLVPYPIPLTGGGRLQARVDEAPLRRQSAAQNSAQPVSHAANRPAMLEEPEPGSADGSTGPLTHHDRKVHLTPAPANPGITPTAMRRKATSQDFLTASAANAAPVARVAPVVEESAAPRSVVMLPAVPLPVASAPQQAAAPAVALGPEMPEPLLAPHELLRETGVLPDPVIFDERGHLLVPAALKGSHEILLHQNEMADADGLTRIQDDDDLERMRRAGGIVGFPEMAGLRADDRLPLNRRFCRPWTAQFLATIARAHYARFGTALQINSAVRTVEFQRRLMRTNGNAAPFEGETASPHLTGQAVDLAKKGLSMTEVAWMRAYLLPLVQAGKIDVEEEFQQACFHISVYRRYAPAVPPRRTMYAARHGADTVLADALAVEK